MGRLLLAIRVFLVTLANAQVAAAVRGVLEGKPGTREGSEKPPAPKPKKTAPREAPVRSDAITLLATLQREARFVDFVQEPLGEFSDAQVGAVARDVHRDCGAVIQRLFGIQPLLSEEEQAEVEVPAGFDAGKYRLTGNVTGEPPFTGRLAHHGWEATRCEVPAWSGSKTAARVVAPAEVELES